MYEPFLSVRANYLFLNRSAFEMLGAPEVVEIKHKKTDIYIYPSKEGYPVKCINSRIAILKTNHINKWLKNKNALEGNLRLYGQKEMDGMVFRIKEIES